MFELYPFQKKCKDALRGNLLRGIKQQILCSPTGSGKTVVAMSIVKDAMEKESRVIFIADRQTLVMQTSDRFTEAGIEHGIAMGTHTRDRNLPIQIASAQTLEKRGFFLSGHLDLFSKNGNGFVEKKPDLIIIDECHEIRKKIIEYAKENNIVTIGLSASPMTKGLGKFYEDVVNVTTTNELVKEGYLAPLKIVAAQREVNVDGLTITNTGEWVRQELGERVETIVGDIVPEWEKQTTHFYGGPVKTICFCASVADSEATAERFQEAGYDFRVVHYRQSADEKQDIIQRFRDDKHIGLISCVALTKGFDVPETRCMIDAYPLRKSLSMHVQKIGRVMRTAPEKDFGLVIDHAGNWLGFWGATQAFFGSGCVSLEESEKLRKTVREKKEKTDHLKCRACGFVLPDPCDECPSCGMKRRRQETVTVHPGRMIEMDGVDGNGITFTGDWWEEVCAIATGFHPQDFDKARRLALAKYKNFFGEWPPGQFQMVHRDPHPEVALIFHQQYLQWKRTQRKSKRESRDAVYA